MNKRLKKKLACKHKDKALYLSDYDKDMIQRKIETRNFFEGRSVKAPSEYIDKLVDIINNDLDRSTYERDIEVILDYKNFK